MAGGTTLQTDQFERIKSQLRTREPRILSDPSKTHAAVAAVFRQPSDELQLLFIRRAEKEGDPWSGHVGFPGGKLEKSDPAPRSAAERETREELGLDLSTAEYLGRMDDLSGSSLPVLVSGFAYHLRKSPSPQLSDEVDEVFWVSTELLCDGHRQVEGEFFYRGAHHPHPAIDLGDDRPLLWGLTYRFVRQLLRTD